MTITPETIAEAISTAPAWAKVALTVPQERLRENARREMAEHVYGALYGSVEPDAAQLPLPL